PGAAGPARSGADNARAANGSSRGARRRSKERKDGIERILFWLTDGACRQQAVRIGGGSNGPADILRV
ncbi:hypothetical protein, partial [Achromobacter pulmonis]|uniref:hypothetical protein n=1 Tax=Achromobacter pulmonis TaxID=1389932 RepID=UPI003C741F16